MSTEPALWISQIQRVCFNLWDVGKLPHVLVDFFS